MTDPTPVSTEKAKNTAPESSPEPSVEPSTVVLRLVQQAAIPQSFRYEGVYQDEEVSVTVTSDGTEVDATLVDTLVAAALASGLTLEEVQ